MRAIDDFLYSNFDHVYPYGDGSDLRVDCPFCADVVGKEDTEGKLHVSVVKEVCHCFRCEYSASWTQLVMDVLDCDYITAVSEIYVKPKPRLDNVVSLLENPSSNKRNSVGHNTNQIPSQNSLERQSTVPKLPKGVPYLYGSPKDKYVVAKRYLVRRGFDEWYWKRYNLGFKDGRIYIPIEGDYWQARAILKNMVPKYDSPKIQSKSLLFNSQALDIYTEVVITEGAFSAMAVGENAVALVGKNPTKEKIYRLLNTKVEHFIITLESIKAHSILRLADTLIAHGRTVTIWEYPDADPADWVEPIVAPYSFKQKVTYLLSF